MSADGKVTLVWGDGENEFRFAIGQFRELQERVNARRQAIGAPIVGPMSLLNLLKTRDAWPDDVRDILRIGLVGAGMSLQDAQRKLVLYFDNRPLIENYRPAYTILAVGLVGDPNDQADAKKKTAATIETSLSGSPKSTEREPQ